MKNTQTILGLTLLWLCLCPMGRANAETVAEPFPPAQVFGTGQQRILIDMPQRTFLLGEPIHIFVGLRNDANVPAEVQNLSTESALKITNPNGEFCLKDLIECSSRPTYIGPHQTLWCNVDLFFYSRMNIAGDYRVETWANAKAPYTPLNIHFRMLEPKGADKKALDWLRAQLAAEAAKMERKESRDYTQTMLIGAMQSHAAGIKQNFPNSVYVQYAAFSYLEYLNSRQPENSSGAFSKETLLACRAFKKVSHSPVLLLFAQLLENKCLLAMGQNIQFPPLKFGGDYMSQELVKFQAELANNKRQRTHLDVNRQTNGIVPPASLNDPLDIFH